MKKTVADYAFEGARNQYMLTPINEMEEKVLWAALCAMVWDIHAPQDNLTVEEWVYAEKKLEELNRKMDKR